MRGSAPWGRHRSTRDIPDRVVEGMAKRALKLGDFGDSAPDKWPAPFDQPARVHVVAAVFPTRRTHIDRVQDQVRGSLT